MAVRSVKGMTIGSPEFVATVKAAEREAEVTELIAEISQGVGELFDGEGALTPEQYDDLRRIGRDINEVTGDC